MHPAQLRKFFLLSGLVYGLHSDTVCVQILVQAFVDRYYRADDILLDLILVVLSKPPTQLASGSSDFEACCQDLWH